jgi:hypothetical protein
MREGRVLSCSRTWKPSAAKRSCQRHTQVFRLAGLSHDLNGADAVGAQQNDVGAPDVLLRCVAIPGKSRQALAIGWQNVKDIPVRIRQTPMRTGQG